MRVVAVLATAVLMVLSAYAGFYFGYGLGFNDGATFVLEEIRSALEGATPGTSI